MAVILLYHRVAEVPSDVWLLCVTPQHFREQLEVLRKEYCPVKLERIGESAGGGSRSVVVTFDDGYADNFYQAKPILEKVDVPATFFLTTGYLGQNEEFWWDELENILLQPRVLPARFRLVINNQAFVWDLGAVSSYNKKEHESHLAWHAWEDPPTSRHALYYSLWQLLYPLASEERVAALEQIRGWASVEPGARSTHRVLSVQEALELSEGDLFELGSHTVTHSMLSSLSKAMQQKEIYRSKTALEAIVNYEVTSFAYPFGKAGDYTAETVAMVREAGFDYACANIEGHVGQGMDRFQLPRVHVQDWSGEEFARQLAWRFES
jgi:peptidoglycan/xylan/chitin deacetylase (PgdA/CDA1 family)